MNVNLKLTAFLLHNRGMMLGLLFGIRRKRNPVKDSVLYVYCFFPRGMESGRMFAAHLAGTVDIIKRTYW